MAKKDTDANQEANASEEGKRKKPWLLFSIIGLVIIIAAAGGAYLFLFSTPSDQKIAAEIAQDTQQQGAAPATPGVGVMMPLDPFIVNLADPKAQHFLKVTITLELRDNPSKDVAEKLLPMIRNDIIMLLSSHTMEDIITMEGKIRLRDEIMARVSRIVGEGRLKNIYFSQFIIQ